MRVTDRFRWMLVAVLAFTIAVPGLPGSGWSGPVVAFADDDDGDDDGGGFSSGEGRDVVRRGSGRGFFRDLRDRFRPRTQSRRAAAPAPLPVRVPNEIVAVGLTADDTAALVSQGFTVDRSEALASFGSTVTSLRIPSGTSLEDAAERVRQQAPAASVDFNHFYRPSQAGCTGSHCVAPQLVNWPAGMSCSGEGLTIGMIDTAINADHAAFAGSRLDITRLSDDALPESGRQHGTAVAALLIGSAQSKTPGLLPDARLFAVDVFHRGERSDERAEAFDLVRGLDRLGTAGVPVINMSLAGPANLVVETAVKSLAERGTALVAAAGNDGPRAAPRFPAAYAEVVAVTAVDRRKRVWRRAAQGTHIDIAAPGVEIWTAASISGARPKTGTSFAAPFVTAALALASRDGTADDIQQLTGSAEDLGDPGHDAAFGWGLLNASDLCKADG